MKKKTIIEFGMVYQMAKYVDNSYDEDLELKAVLLWFWRGGVDSMATLWKLFK